MPQYTYKIKIFSYKTEKGCNINILYYIFIHVFDNWIKCKFIL